MSSRMIQRSFALLALAVVAACASSGASSGAAPINRAVITDAEIPTTGTESAYDLIQRLRPEYLRTKPSQAYTVGNSPDAPPPSVFLNGQRIGELADLRRISAPTLSMVRYYNIEEGKRKYGMQYGGGIIEIKYRIR